MFKFNNKVLNPGEYFIYKGIEWVCLDIIDSNYLAITAQVWQELPFDIDNLNNWKNSSLRRVLNDEFLDKLNVNHLVLQTSDMIADNGDGRYGTCREYVTILSCDQYRKYRDIVPFFEEGMWTLTPWSCEPSELNFVRYVDTEGNMDDYFANHEYGVAPVCLFSSKKLKLYGQACLIGVDEDDVY